MNYKVSKELFEAVYNCKIESLKILEDKDKPYNSAFMIVSIKDYGVPVISICEFVFKSKIWALEQGYQLISKIKIDGSGFCEGRRKNFTVLRNKAQTEEQSVINSCQWILENK